MIVEEKLRADVVGPFIDFRLQMIHFQHAVRGGRMTFGETRDTDAKSAFVGVGSRIAELANESNQIRRVLESVLASIIAGEIAWRVAAQSENVADACRGVALENAIDVLFAVANAGQVRNRIQRGLRFDPNNKVMGEFAGGPPGTIGDTDKGGMELFQFPDRLIQGLRGLGGFWRKELE